MEQRQMTNLEAIKILDEIAAKANLDRNGHNILYTATAVLTKLDNDYKALQAAIAKPKAVEPSKFETREDELSNK